MIASLLLIGSAALDWGVSPLVEPTHRHEWVPLTEGADFRLAWDRNSISERNIQGANYPVVLLRGGPKTSDDTPRRLDALVAVDCNDNEIATLDLHTELIGSGKTSRETPDKLNFGSLPDPKSNKTQAMMRAICGEDWSL